ncbi:hypothetical protein EGW08_001582, partial [Elysia chlorotica]
AAEQEIDIVKISYDDIKKIVLASRYDAESDNRKGNVAQLQKSRRPAQQIYRPGRHSAVTGKPAKRNENITEGSSQTDGRKGHRQGEEEDWDASAERDFSRESSGEIADESLSERLDDLYIESPPREIKESNVWSDSQTKKSQSDTSQVEGEKDNGKKRRGKRPDIQVYVPRARMGHRENRSEEKESSPVATAETDSYEAGKENRDWDTVKPESEIVISGSPDCQRKVQVQSKGRAMKVTVLKDTPVYSDSLKSHDSNNPPAKDDKQSSNWQKLPQHGKDTGKVEQVKERQGQSKKVESISDCVDEGNSKYNKEGAKKLDHWSNTGRENVSAEKKVEVGKVYQDQAETMGRKPCRRNRRSNSNDSRPIKSDKPGKESEQVISRTFPRSKGVSSKSAAAQNESGDLEKSRRDPTGKGNGRDNEKFYWGMRRQRTGSISSEASVASNNGSFYSGSSDFTDDEPEHILDWGAEVEKAHLEEVARLINDGAQRLTSSLDAYPDGKPSGKPENIEVPSELDPQKSLVPDRVYQPKREDVGTHGRRNRRRKNTSRHGSRDSSVHSSIHGDETGSERGNRRHRHRRGSKDSQSHGHHREQHQFQPDTSSHHHQKHRYGQQAGPAEGGRGHRSGLQVTVGQNNRHVAISPQAGGSGSSTRQRHPSHENLESYTVDSGGEDWDRDIQNNMARSWRDDEDKWPNSHSDWQGNKSPRFERKNGEGGGRGRQRKNSKTSHEEEPQYQRDRRDKQRLHSGDYAEDSRREENVGQRDRGKHHEDHKGNQQPRDQRLVNPAYDASTGFSSRGRGRGQGQRQGGSNRGRDSQKVGGRAMSEDYEDRCVPQARERGLLKMPVLTHQEPPRPSSTPSAAERHLIQQQHQYRLEDPEGSSSRGMNMRGPIHGAKQLFDPKNPSKPIVISEGNPVPPQFEGVDSQTPPGSGSGFGPPSPENVVGGGPHPQPGYPHPMYPPDYPPMYGYRPRMPPFMPPAPYMRGFPPGSMPPHPHPAFFGYPQMPPMVPPFYNNVDADNDSMAAASRSQSRMMAEQILRDSHPFDCQLGNIMSRRPYSDDSIRMLNQIRAELQSRLERVILLDIEVANKHGVEQALWKSVYYQVIETHRRRMTEEGSSSGGRQRLMEVLEEGTHFFESLLKKLQATYDFDLDQILNGGPMVPENSNRLTRLALLCVQKVMMFLGDIARYREQSSDSTNYGKARQWYLKAQKIHPRNGRPYNQLAILAVYTRRKLDAVYYYMRSLAASNPILTARESLMSIFDEVRRKVDIVEKKRFQDRKHRMDIRRKRQAQGPRVEIWVMPDGTSTQDEVNEEDEEEDLSSLSAVELNKRFVLTFLNVHGKLFTKINFEVFAESSSLMLLEFESLIQHSPCVFSSTRLLQLMVINMFSIDNTALKDESLEENCRSLLQEHAVEIALEMFGLLVRGEDPTHVAGGWLELLSEDLHNMLPALKTWVDWMMCHAHLWNPQPFNRPPELGPHIDVWENLAKFCDLLNGVETKQGCLIREQKPGYEPIVLQEDSTLAGFIPMLSAPQEIFYADSSVDKRQAEDWLRIEKLRLFGEYLCGVEPAMLGYNVETGNYYSVAPRPSQSEEKLHTEMQEDADSGEEVEHDASESDDVKEGQVKDDIERLKDKKEKLKQKRKQREKAHENREAILDSHKHAKIELEIRPIFLIPDTNCFIDHFVLLRKILHSKKYTLVLPLICLFYFEMFEAHRHYIKVSLATYLNGLHMTTTKLILSHLFLNLNLTYCNVIHVLLQGINDDIILNCCLHYCKDLARDFMPKGKDEPVRLRREVVLLTEDRNLRLKAHTCNVPVKDVPRFKRWSKIL